MKTPESISFQQAWLCEAMRLRESQWGPRDDSKARLLAQHELSPLAKVVRRAEELSQSSGLTTTISKLSQAGWFAFAAILVVAILAGGSLALAALGNSTQPVNIVWALLTLLSLNVFTLLVWCLMLFSPTASGGRLAQLWPWLTRKLARGPDMGLAVQAWWSVWHQAQATRWILSLGTHLIWMIILLAAALTMLFTLSTRQYDFVWETTVLSPDIFVQWIGRLGVIPHWFGFAVPDTESIRSSGSVSSTDTEALRRLWSEWLLGCLLVYGVLPRTLLSIVSALIIVSRRVRIKPDLASPYYVAILNKMPSSELLAHDNAPPESVFEIGTEQNIDPSESWNAQHILIAIEPDPSELWPPEGIGSALTFAGSIDSRASRQHALSLIAQTRPNNLILVCDARHSPDRGTLRLIGDLSEHSKRTLIWLRHSQASHAHTEAWLSQLRGLSQIELKVRDDALSVMQWVERHHD
jgi:hypothetical protein